MKSLETMRLGRRQFLFATAGLAATGLLAACGDDDDDDDDSGAAAATATSAPAGDATEASDDSTEAATEVAGDSTEPEATEADEPAEGEAKIGGVLLIGQDFGPQDLDPTISGAWASTNVQELIYTALLRWSPEMQLEPDLATSWEMDDAGVTYTFELREGVTFHNGKAFSSEDVKFTFERILTPEVASPRITIFQGIDTIEAASENSVTINLSTPVAPLLRNLATIPHGAIVPAGATDDELNTTAPGTGAFRFVEHMLDQEVRLEKFEDYYEEGLPYLDGVIFKLLADDTSISAALRAETVHMAWLKDPKVAQNVAESTDNLESVAGVSSRYLPTFFNQTEAPFDDVNVRRAMSVALDRSIIVQAVLGGFGSVGTFLPPSQLAGYVGDGAGLPYYTQDTDQAKALLAEAGYEDGIDVEFKVVAANQLDVQCAQIMKEQWAAAGINVEIAPLEVGAILEDWRNGDFQMAAVGTVWAPDPSNEVTRLYSESSFATNIGLNDPDMDALVEAGLSESDPEKRVEIYDQIQERALDQAYLLVPYTYPLRWELLWNFVKGYDVMASNARLTVRKTWLDK